MEKKILVVYYTHSGNTRHVAKQIAAQTGAELLEIKPVIAYPQEYNTVVAQAKKEIGQKYHPPIENTVDLSAYDTVFVGSPNWWSTIAPPVATFLVENDLTGKTVLPFITHGGGGLNHTVKDIRALCHGATVTDALSAYADGGRMLDAEISAWLAQSGLAEN